MTVRVRESASSSVDERATDDRAEHLREVVRRWFPDVWRFLRRLGFPKHVADDAAQDLFFVALRRIDEIQPGRERGFLFGAAVRIAVQLKRKRERDLFEESLVEDVADTAATPDDLLDDERARAVGDRILAELDENQRVVFVLYEIEELTMQEIASLLEIPLGTVASRLRRGREAFAERLAHHQRRWGSTK